ncbi:glycosyltransferase [Bacillota bacterium LCP21S3_D9]
MRKKILLIPNTYPFSGEPFLKTEISFLPEKLSVDAWPFFIDQSKENSKVTPQIETHIYKKLPALGRIKNLCNALNVFFSEKEYKAAFVKRRPVRNVIKAIKFAYISELRFSSVKEWMNEQGNQTENTLIYSYWMYETAYVAARLKTVYPNCVFITRCHGYDLYEERHPNGYLPFRSFILKHADMICPISENGKDYLLKLYGGKIENKIQIARLGTIRKADIPGKQEKEDCIVLVSCSNLVDVKRVHLIINALMNCHNKVHWYHFGDGELRDKLEAQAKALPEHVKCTFMGYRANEEVQKFYADHYIHAFLNVSQSEGIPVSVMEAESYGIPIIATDVGGTSEIVHDRDNGVLLDVNFTDKDLIDAIDEVVDNADRYRLEALRTWGTMSDANKVFPEFYKKLAEV